jgi:hypothetical protein
MNKWTTEVKENEDGELYIELDDQALEAAGLKTGDTVRWIDNGDGSWSIVKAEPEAKKTQWVLVEAVSTFRMRYMVEVPQGRAEWALDTVSMEEAKEFSQHHLGETIVSHRVVDRDEALKICDADNEYFAVRSDEDKIRTFFTTWAEQNDK